MPANGILTAKYRPRLLADLVGQPQVVRRLRSFVEQKPGPIAFLFHGPSGVGKTVAAQALANELGCDPDWGGILEIASGTQDGKAVGELLRKLSLRPLMGSPWKVAIVNEADRMSDQAEVMWLDGLDNLPPHSVVIFTTNNSRKLSYRFRRRCEIHEFDGFSTQFRLAMEELVRRVFKAETGKDVNRLPEGLGRFEAASPDHSIALALQQIAPYLRTGDELPAAFVVPIVREEQTSGKARLNGHSGPAREASAKGVCNTEPAEDAPPKATPETQPKPIPPAAEPEPQPAKYRAKCQVCGQWIEPGQPWRLHHRGPCKLRWAHATCGSAIAAVNSTLPPDGPGAKKTGPRAGQLRAQDQS